MKTIGIEIKGCRINLIVLKKDSNSVISIINNDFKTIEIETDTDNKEIKRFLQTLHSYFDSIAADRIAIIKRNPNASGKYAVSALSFKVEGLIQLYDAIPIEFVPSQKIASFYKKNDFPITPKYDYQVNPAKLAYLLIQEP